MYDAVHSHSEFSLVENNDLTFLKMQNCILFYVVIFDTLLQVAEYFIPQVPQERRHVIYYNYHYKNINVITHTSLKKTVFNAYIKSIQGRMLSSMKFGSFKHHPVTISSTNVF